MSKETIWRTEPKHMTMAELKGAVEYLKPHASVSKANARLRDLQTELRIRGVG